MYNIAEKKYYDILKRSFEKSFDLFLLKVIIEEKGYENVAQRATTGEFTDFLQKMKTDDVYKETLIGLNQKAYQCRKGEDNFEDLKVKEIDKMFDKWYEENATDPFKVIYQLTFLDKEVFFKKYGQDADERQCRYCKITEKQILKLLEYGEIKTKRFGTRGRLMEIDRVRPNDEYQEDNIVFSCYWCNNAKTDEFTYDEFKLIGDEIGKIWERRLSALDNNKL